MGAEFMVEHFHKHACAIGMPKDARVLDVAAGTGIQGVIVSQLHFGQSCSSGKSMTLRAFV